jgi:hypothetical protein
MSSFDVGAENKITLPVPDGWTAVHDPATQTIVVHDANFARRVTFEYALCSTPVSAWLKNRVLVQAPRYGGRVNASTALEMLATQWGPFRK